jgi:hypothetical protein
VLASVDAMRGDFPCYIYLVPLEKELLPEKYFPVIGALCEHLKCCALDATGDGTSNPYLFTYICGVDDYQLVKVDPDKLDEEDHMQFDIVEHIRRVGADSE